MSDAYVTIVGGGPAGLTTALTLVRRLPRLAGRVVVLERSVYPRDKICAGAIGERGWRLLEQLDARPQIEAVRIHGIRLRGFNGHPRVRPGAVGWVVHRREFDAALADVARRAGVRIEDGTPVHDVCLTAQRVELGALGATLTTDIVVGADGIGSRVRRAMGLPPGRVRARAIEVDTSLTASDPIDELVFDVTDPRLSGYAWHFPTRRDGKMAVCRGVYALPHDGRYPDLASHLYDILPNASDSALDRPRRFAERGFEPGTKVVNGRAVLVGEAIGIDPVTGEGIGPAIESGELLGRHLIEVIEGRAQLDAWQRVFDTSRLGRDLWMRSRLARLFYGSARPWLDAVMTSNDAALRVLAPHFAGRSPAWPCVARLAFTALAEGARNLWGHA